MCLGLRNTERNQSQCELYRNFCWNFSSWWHSCVCCAKARLYSMYPWLVFLFLPLLMVRVWLWLWWVRVALDPFVVHLSLWHMHTHTYTHIYNHTCHPLVCPFCALLMCRNCMTLSCQLLQIQIQEKKKSLFSCIHVTFSFRTGLSNVTFSNRRIFNTVSIATML